MECSEKIRLEIYQYCHENIRDITGYPQLMNEAANSGYFQIVKYLDSIGSKCTRHAMDNAARNGHLDILTFLHENRSEGCSKYAMDLAAKFGQLECIKFLHFNRTEGCTLSAMDNAAKHGHLDVVQWLYENRTEGCSEDAIRWAAECYQVDVLKWLYSKYKKLFTKDIIERWPVYVNWSDDMKEFFDSIAKSV